MGMSSTAWRAVIDEARILSGRTDMAKSIEQLVQETLGAQALTILRLTSENESLHDRIKELEAAQTPKA
jgi:hypothetical protein